MIRQCIYVASLVNSKGETSFVKFAAGCLANAVKNAILYANGEDHNLRLQSISYDSDIIV